MIPVRARKYRHDTLSTPKPYVMLRLKLMELASSKYFVGQVTSAIKKGSESADRQLSKTKSSEQRGIRISATHRPSAVSGVLAELLPRRMLRVA